MSHVPFKILYEGFVDIDTRRDVIRPRQRYSVGLRRFIIIKSSFDSVYTIHISLMYWYGGTFFKSLCHSDVVSRM